MGEIETKQYREEFRGLTDDLDCYLFYVASLLGNDTEHIGMDVIGQVKAFSMQLDELAQQLVMEKARRESSRRES